MVGAESQSDHDLTTSKLKLLMSFLIFFFFFFWKQLYNDLLLNFVASWGKLKSQIKQVLEGFKPPTMCNK